MLENVKSHCSGGSYINEYNASIHTDAVELHDIINEKHIHCWHIHVKTQ